MAVRSYPGPRLGNPVLEKALVALLLPLAREQVPAGNFESSSPEEAEHFVGIFTGDLDTVGPELEPHFEWAVRNVRDEVRELVS